MYEDEGSAMNDRSYGDGQHKRPEKMRLRRKNNSSFCRQQPHRGKKCITVLRLNKMHMD